MGVERIPGAVGIFAGHRKMRAAEKEARRAAGEQRAYLQEQRQALGQQRQDVANEQARINKERSEQQQRIALGIARANRVRRKGGIFGDTAANEQKLSGTLG